jgi:hypothetical protein
MEEIREMESVVSDVPSNKCDARRDRAVYNSKRRTRTLVALEMAVQVGSDSRYVRKASTGGTSREGAWRNAIVIDHHTDSRKRAFEITFGIQPILS